MAGTAISNPLWSRAEGRPCRGITWEWETFGEYLDALERMHRAVDVGTQIPQTALRAYVMGDRALDAPTADDLADMSRAVFQGRRDGALGMSFS